jgi:hypothetical protein
MSRTLKFLFGLWVGASTLAYPVAACLLYMLTGKLPMPIIGKKKPRLVSPDEAVAQVRALAESLSEITHG